MPTLPARAGKMETSFFQSLITRQPCEEMSYKVQRPFPTMPAALFAVTRDALAGLAWWGACGVPWPLCPGTLGLIPLHWPCAGSPASSSPPVTSTGTSVGGPGITLHPSERTEVARAPLGSTILPGFEVSPSQSHHLVHLHPAASQLPLQRDGVLPGGHPRSAWLRGHRQPCRPAPPAQSVLFPAASVGSGREGTDAAAPAAKALPSVCAGLPGWGGHHSPSHPTSALGHCSTGGLSDTQNRVPRALLGAW